MTGRSLRDYLLQKAAALQAAALRRPRGSDWHERIEAVCVADDATGTRKLRIRDWQFVSDSGPDFGGWSLGPSSPELLCGVLSTCLTHTYLIGAATLGIPVDRVEVRVTAENNDARFLGIETADPDVPFALTARIRVESEGISAQQRAVLHDYVGESCPLTRLIRQPQEIRLVIDA